MWWNYLSIPKLELKMNAVSHKQLTFQMLTLQQSYLCHHSQYSNAWDNKSLARKLRVRLPLRSRHFLFLKLWHFHKNIRSWFRNECCCPLTFNISNINFTTKISMPGLNLIHVNNMGHRKWETIYHSLTWVLGLADSIFCIYKLRSL